MSLVAIVGADYTDLVGADDGIPSSKHKRNSTPPAKLESDIAKLPSVSNSNGAKLRDTIKGLRTEGIPDRVKHPTLVEFDPNFLASFRCC